MDKPKNYLSIPEAAKIMGLSRIAVFKKVKNGTIPAIKIGRAYAIAAKSLDFLIGKALSAAQKKEIDGAVKKTVKEYGETLKLLGRE
jgi:excisionase family DNA binding protein